VLSLADALSWTSRLVAASVLLQTVELLSLRRAFTAGGALATVARGGLSGPLHAQLALAFVLLFVGTSPLFLGLLASYWLVNARLGGPFNGGSDAMTSLSLLMLGIAGSDPFQSVIMRGALAYLGVQTVFSYFVAGLSKLKEPGWRRGSALLHFAALPKYGVPEKARVWLAKPGVAPALSWAILLFECSFPLALRGQTCCLVYLSLGVGFHAANALLFGLNRFFFSWIAVYPVLLALSQPWLPAL
jgi:hypothetical protein